MASSHTYQKGLGPLTGQEQIEGVGSLGWNLLRESLTLPAAVLIRSRLEHNLRWMAEFARRYGVQLAPHGKTTMAPRLFQLQLDAGAWGITLATAQQCAVAHAHGVRRILMANQLVGRANLELISTVLAGGTHLYTLVDSPTLVDQLGAFFKNSGQSLRVLLEIGVRGGRAGTRTQAQTEAVVERIARWPGTLLLSGVEVYEGVAKDEETVRDYLVRAVEMLRALQQGRAFAPGDRPILSGAGSAWYDLVADAFAPMRDEADVVLRPGCYLTSDAGVYRAAQEQISRRNRIAQEVDRQLGGTLLPALEVWAYVQSLPEPGLAIVGLGKRDAAFDAGLPQPVWHFRPGQHRAPVAPPKVWTTTKLMDQHAFLQISDAGNLQVGDMLGFEISHPCLTFDKWRYVALVDDHYNVVEAIPTAF